MNDNSNKYSDIFYKKCCFYKEMSFSHYERSLSVLEALSLFTSNFVKDQTQYIQKKFGKYIKNGFPSIEKKDYQTLKRKILPSVVFSGVINRKKGSSQNQYNGIVVLDLDDNPELLLKKFYENPPKECLAFGMSVSGYPNGWALIYTEASTEKEYKKYSTAIKYWISKNYNLNCMVSDPKRVRYVSYDPEVYINTHPNIFCNEQRKKHQLALDIEANERDNIADSIEQTEWSKFCDEYARKKGFDFIKGQRHMYLNNFAICANLIGVKKQNLDIFVFSKLIDKRSYSDSNALEFPYQSYKESFAKWSWRLENNSTPTTDISLKENEYISDKGIDFCGKILFAPTGTGKTFAAVNLREKVVIAVPYYSLCQNIASEYDITPINGRKKFPDSLKDKYVTTYASLEKVVRSLGRNVSDYHLIVDEAHNLSISASRSFMLDNLDFITWCMQEKKFKSNTLLSGTWLPNIHPTIKQMEVIKITKPRKKKLLYYYHCQHTLKGVVDLCEQSISSGSFPFVLQNDISIRRETLIGALEERGLKLKSFTSRDKNDPDFEDLVNDSIIDPSISGIVTTTVLKEGNNINNEFESVDVIILGSYHSSEIEQASQRFRKARNINIRIVKKDPQETTSVYLGRAEQYTWNALKEARDKLDKNWPTSKLEEYFRRQFDFYPYKVEDYDIVLDYLMLSEIGCRFEKINESQNVELQKRNLKKYGILFVESFFNKGKLEKSEIIESRKFDYEQVKHYGYVEQLSEIESIDPKIRPKFTQDLLRYESNKLTKGELLAARHFVSLCKYQDSRTVLKFMKACEPIKSRLEKIERYFLFNAYYHTLEDHEKGFIDKISELAPQCSNLPEIAAAISFSAEKFGVACGKIKFEIQKYKTTRDANVAHSKIFVQTKRVIESMFEVKSKRKTINGIKVSVLNLLPRKKIPPYKSNELGSVLNEFMMMFN